MKTLVIGCRGFIGRRLWKAYGAAGTHHIPLEEAHHLDLNSPNIANLSLDWKEYSHAVIASGITKVGLCENQKEATYLCNVKGTLDLARQLTAKGIFPVFFSSDYVFDGTHELYTELSPVNPLNEYGKQKAILEREIPHICGKNYLILRVSKVFGLEDRSLIDELALSLYQKKPIRAAHDQLFSPIFLEDLIRGILALQKIGATGLYQLCGTDSCSRYELACQVAHSLDIDPILVERISLDDLNELFKRPKNTCMSNRQFIQTTNLQLTPLASCIKKITDSYKGKS